MRRILVIAAAAAAVMAALVLLVRWSWSGMGPETTDLTAPTPAQQSAAAAVLELEEDTAFSRLIVTRSPHASDNRLSGFCDRPCEGAPVVSYPPGSCGSVKLDGQEYSFSSEYAPGPLLRVYRLADGGWLYVADCCDGGALEAIMDS